METDAGIANTVMREGIKMKQREYPNYYRKNFVKGIEKRREKATTDETGAREEMALKIEKIILASLERKGINGEERKRIWLTSHEEAVRFQMRKNFCEGTIQQITGKKKTGTQYARERLREETAELLPDFFCVPEPMPKKQRDILIYRNKKDAADMTMRLYAIACKEVLGYETEDIKVLCEDVRKQYQERQDHGTKNCRRDCRILHGDPRHDEFAETGKGEDRTKAQ